MCLDAPGQLAVSFLQPPLSLGCRLEKGCMDEKQERKIHVNSNSNNNNNTST